jgi:hypothetical protein
MAVLWLQLKHDGGQLNLLDSHTFQPTEVRSFPRPLSARRDFCEWHVRPQAGTAVNDGWVDVEWEQELHATLAVIAEECNLECPPLTPPKPKKPSKRAPSRRKTEALDRVLQKRAERKQQRGVERSPDHAAGTHEARGQAEGEECHWEDKQEEDDGRGGASEAAEKDESEVGAHAAATPSSPAPAATEENEAGGEAQERDCVSIEQ